MKNYKAILALAAGLLMFGATASADDPPLVDGSIWTVSTEAEKEAYLIGAGNFMTVEYIVQSKADTAPSEDQSAISRWYAALEDSTIDELVAAVDDYYASNADELDTPVLVAIWNTFVETD